MDFSAVPARLLSPAPMISPQHSGKSNSTGGSSGGTYFSSISPRTAAQRGPSPFEAGFPSPLPSPSCLSGFGSEFSGDSNYLTPPITPGDYEKPPYKARSESAASLNMSSHIPELNLDPNPGHQSTTRSSRSKRRAFLENQQQNGISREHDCVELGCLASCEYDMGKGLRSDDLSQEIGDSAQKIRRLMSDAEGFAGKNENQSSQLMSEPVASAKTQRCSSAGIKSHEMPSEAWASGMMNEDALTGIHQWNRIPSFSFKETNIASAVRARLTARKVSDSNHPLPAKITLRRASSWTMETGQRRSATNEWNANPSTSAELKQTEEQEPLISYLITSDDVEFIINLVRSRFGARKTTGDTLKRINERPSRPCITRNGVLPRPSTPAKVAVTIPDIQELGRLRVSFESNLAFDPKQDRHQINTLSRALSQKTEPHIIWEDSRKVGETNYSSEAGSSHAESSEIKDDSTAAWLLEKRSSKGPKSVSSDVSSPNELASQSTDRGDDSLNGRIFRWGFEHQVEDKMILQLPGKARSLSIILLNGEPTTFPGPDIPGLPIKTDFEDVVSFPPLPVRHCTNDWISPLPDLTVPAFPVSTRSLYNVGIDACVGGPPTDRRFSQPETGKPEIVVEEPQQQQRSPNVTTESLKRPKSVNILHCSKSSRLGDIFKPGNAIGLCGGERRKSSTHSMRIKIDSEALEHHLREDEASWVKPRKDSGWPAPKTPSPEELDSRKDSNETLTPPPRVSTIERNKGK